MDIVLYLYIYIALLAEHTSQKCFQCKRPSEKIAVLRELRRQILNFMWALASVVHEGWG